MTDFGKTLIMKFGGASVATAESFEKVADLILERNKTFSKIVVVVSAMQGMTDELINLAKKVHPEPPRREYDMLVSSGERISIALLAMALARKQSQAVSFTGSQSGIITSADHTEAKIINVRPERILAALKEEKIVIVAGFQGVSETREITTLGRGGSDTSAVALGISLNAQRVEFYKDVEGVFAEDPKKVLNAMKYAILDYKRAKEVINKTGGKIIHPRALLLAEKNTLPLYVRSFQKEREGTLICSENAPDNNVPKEAVYEW